MTEEDLCRHLQSLKLKETARSASFSLLSYFLSQPKRSRRRHRRKIKRLARIVKHPELGVLYILRRLAE